MKRFLTLALTLSLTLSCASGPELLPTDGALGKQVVRVCLRHDAYVQADVNLAQPLKDALLSESATAGALVALPEVSAGMLGEALGPVLDRHDVYVSADPALDDLERDTYLGSSDGLRRLLAGE